MMTIQCLHQVSQCLHQSVATQGHTSCIFLIKFESLFCVCDINMFGCNNGLRSLMLVEKNKQDS